MSSSLNSCASDIPVTEEMCLAVVPEVVGNPIMYIYGHPLHKSLLVPQDCASFSCFTKKETLSSIRADQQEALPLKFLTNGISHTVSESKLEGRKEMRAAWFSWSAELDREIKNYEAATRKYQSTLFCQ